MLCLFTTLSFNGLCTFVQYLGRYMSFSFILTVAVAIALGILLGWHIILVSRAETTIEFQQNYSDRKHAKERKEPPPKHPYSRSLRRNWQFFFNLTGKRTLLSVLLPSTHHPAGNGWDWSHLTQSKDNASVI
eukprot:TRINITY_DN11605_c3_g1_i11.p1 TRINITY_DN11605_c3_g1~~TRINITY_DN11605_c3_g1_i11.p1  ORF type:complete len:132 (+),score=13.55 TRINITY_DN11605_c3_g1_i11:289-684(+)